MIKENKNIKYLIGNNTLDLKSTIPYSDIFCDFLDNFSKALDSYPQIRKFPDLKTLAFWCRKKNILKFRNNSLLNETRLGLGMIFHITPSNIPTNFAYSLIFGLINGNSNIVKVPSKKFVQIDIVCNILKKVLKIKKFKKINKFITIVRYKDNDNFTKKISSICNARVVWGGDKSVATIRQFPLMERAIDISFADRYSFCIINSSKISNLNKFELKLLVEKFYNDTYLVDQNACSSPHLVVWLGKDNIKLREKFWKYLLDVVKRKYDLTETASLDKYNQLCENILNLKSLKNQNNYENFIFTNQLSSLDKNIHNLRGKWGFFYEYITNDINKISKYVNNKYQTLTYFGLDKKEIKKFIVENEVNGIDRVVPIGQALDMSFYWDGYDLNRILSRIVDIK
tara:strand:- start:1015 stop:2208 length:1194 start_codon:yes stop_codon:yes gene_type:complete